MDFSFYQTQINRLINNYGERAFSDEKVKALWKALKDVPGPIFDTAVNSLIMNCRASPTLTDFNEKINEARVMEQKRTPQLASPDSFGPSSFNDGDIKFMTSMISARMRGAVSDADWRVFREAIDKQGKNK